MFKSIKWMLFLIFAVSVNADIINVGVLQNTKPRTCGSKGIVQTLENNENYKLKIIDEISTENLKDIDVIIISHAYNLANMDALRTFVQSGGGALLTHDAAGSGRGSKGRSSFPEIADTSHKGSGYLSPNSRVVPISKHPITEGIDDKGFNHTYWDHAILKPVDDRLVLTEDTAFSDRFNNNRFRGTQLRWNSYFGGNAVILASPFGEGRVVLCGLMFGWNRKHHPTPLVGSELRFLENSISWLADKSPLGLPEKIELTKDSKYSRHLEQKLPEYITGAIKLITPISESKAGDKQYLKVKISTDGSLAEILSYDFRIIVAVEKEDNIPTIQSLQVRDFKWHRTWDGLERNSLTAPLLRLSKTLWPFEKPFPSMDHERGSPLPEIKGTELRFSERVTLKVGAGEITATHAGRITLKGFCNEGRIATEAFDGYQCDGTWYEESVSYDQPVIQGDWVWAVCEDSFAIGGKLIIDEKMGETGLSTGIERQITVTGNTLIITTQTGNLNAAVSIEKTQKSQDASLVLKPKKVFLKKLWKMRGKDDFFPVLPESVEIYKDEIPSGTEVVSWKLENADDFMIASDNKDTFTRQVQDNDFLEAQKRFDPHGEDKDLWRRVFVQYTGKKIPVDAKGKLIGFDKSGQAVVSVPLKLSTYISLPVGIFTYTAQWCNQEKRIPRDQWPKLMRDISLQGLDYIIHEVNSASGGETGEKILNRLNRYGTWCLGAMLSASRSMLRATKTIDPAKLENIYSNTIQQYGSNINILGWYLSDEMATGKPGDENFEKSYGHAKLLYDTCNKLDSDRWAVNLITRSHTPHEVAAKYLKTDLFSWDPYGTGAKSAYREAALVDRLWRKVKDKPSWITLRCGGPNFYDCLDLWLDIRRRSAAAYRGNVDGINYFMYAHWNSGLEKDGWSAVFPGSQGPIGTPRWQGLGEIVKDVALLATTEYLLQNYTGSDKTLLQKQYDQAKQLGQAGQFYQMRQALRDIINKLK